MTTALYWIAAYACLGVGYGLVDLDTGIMLRGLPRGRAAAVRAMVAATWPLLLLLDLAVIAVVAWNAARRRFR